MHRDKLSFDPVLPVERTSPPAPMSSGLSSWYAKSMSPGMPSYFFDFKMFVGIADLHVADMDRDGIAMQTFSCPTETRQIDGFGGL